ncbi:DUF4112 domain-containing protein [Halegenticoccus soli]|uniref:DUF4112 domain-containing protein n=1 Tax=Halegenticoccus soli TaxID=1985678 RepID=UPI000C6DC93A|nr:DUF4112 domain-containing protein [Halegenticoccus soli]
MSEQPAQTRPRRDAEREGAGDATRERLRALSYLLDNAIRVPGTDRRVGLDPVVGLVPVVGEFPTTALSAYIVAEAVHSGVPRATFLRMLFNLSVDAIVGAIPVVGDAFDAAWKANARNVALLEARVDDPNAARTDRRYLAVTTGAILLFLLGIGAAATGSLLWLLRTAGVL